MADPDVQRALDDALRDPRAWLEHADQLKRAADVLLVGFQNAVAGAMNVASFEEMPSTITEVASNSARPPRSQFSLGVVYLMVAGYAIENLAKGLIVARDKSDATIKAITNRHVSLPLLERAGVELVDGEPDLVRRLGVRVKWAGRYPVPKLVEDLAAARVGDLWENVLRVSTTDGYLLDGLFERMRAELEALAPTAM